MPAPHRLRKSKERLRRYLAQGWSRAVFATPQRDDLAPEAEVVEYQVEAPLDFDRLFERACDAASRGLVKQTFVLSAQRKIAVDARNGILQERRMDEDRALKVMGGKERSFRPDESADLLRAIGIMNPDGTISAKHAKKYKQISHLSQLVAPTWQQLSAQQAYTDERPLRIIDLACGNSYLTFILAESLRLARLPATILGVDVREDVISRSQARAQTLSFPHVHFRQSTISNANAEIGAVLGGTTDIVVALHACDTATDEALAFAIGAKAPAILCVPCCHAEVAAQLAKAKRERLPALYEQGLLRRSYGESLTDAFRVEILEAFGYDVSTVEFVGSEHTPKNLLIRAVKSAKGPNAAQRRETLGRLEAYARELGIWPNLLARAIALGNQ